MENKELDRIKADVLAKGGSGGCRRRYWRARRMKSRARQWMRNRRKRRRGLRWLRVLSDTCYNLMLSLFYYLTQWLTSMLTIIIETAKCDTM